MVANKQNTALEEFLLSLSHGFVFTSNAHVHTLVHVHIWELFDQNQSKAIQQP